MSDFVGVLKRGVNGVLPAPYDAITKHGLQIGAVGLKQVPDVAVIRGTNDRMESVQDRRPAPPSTTSVRDTPLYPRLVGYDGFPVNFERYAPADQTSIRDLLSAIQAGA